MTSKEDKERQVLDRQVREGARGQLRPVSTLEVAKLGEKLVHLNERTIYDVCREFIALRNNQ